MPTTRGEEKRKYIRLNSCFPVEFSLIFSDPSTRSACSGLRPSTKKYQAFTHDISKEGLCIRVKDLTPPDEQALANKKVKLQLAISIFSPIFAKPINATCAVAWIEETEKTSERTWHSIGVVYEQILPKYKKQILNRARGLKWAPRITAVAVLALLLGLVAIYSYQQQVKHNNQVLVNRLVEVSETRNNIFKQLNNLNQAKIFLERRLAETSEEIQKVDEIKTKIEAIAEGEKKLEKQLASIEIESNTLEQANLQKMKEWVSVHRNRRTGLVISYEGDKNLKDWSFTYDQALSAQLFIIFKDMQKASAILNFYKEQAKKERGLFYNAYDAQTGNVVEYVLHSGPNLWIAMAACKFTKYANDNEYLGLAESIANVMISMQKKSADYSIKGGPKLNWVSTEHNMDAYALFNMLYEITGKEKYKNARENALSWLKQSAYNKPQGRFNRGKGDSTIATDTFSWAIASISPSVLKENGMDPDGIIEFAEAECRVKTQFYRPDGESIEVNGFDFAKAAHMGRGGIISCEWSAQMIVAFKMMAGYHQILGNIRKSSEYAKKAEYYLVQLSKMVVSSPSPSGQGEGCLPYASIDNVDTGHGWRVAKGRRTGSVAATVYYIFAQRGYNPLKL